MNKELKARILEFKKSNNVFKERYLNDLVKHLIKLIESNYKNLIKNNYNLASYNFQFKIADVSSALHQNDDNMKGLDQGAINTLIASPAAISYINSQICEGWVNKEGWFTISAKDFEKALEKTEEQISNNMINFVSTIFDKEIHDGATYDSFTKTIKFDVVHEEQTYQVSCVNKKDL